MKVGGLWKYVSDLFGQRKSKTDWIVIQEPSALSSDSEVPWELKYVLSLRPSRQEMISGMLEDGYGLGLSYHKKSPEHVKRSVRRVADLTQEGLVHHWLEKLLKHGQSPIWAQREEEDAKAQGVDLKQEVENIKKFSQGHGRLALVKFPGMAADETSLESLHELNQEMRPIAAPWLLSLLLEEVEVLKFPILILVALVFIFVAPLAHLFQVLLPGLGLWLAAVFPAVFFFGKDAYKTYIGNRFAWRVKSNLWGIVTFVLALVLTSAVWPLESSGQLILAGMFFAVGIVLVPVLQILRRFIHMTKAWRKLLANGKIGVDQGYGWMILGEEARGLIIRLAGLVISWFFIVWSFFAWSNALGNGWFLAGMACLPFVLAEGLAWAELKLERVLHARAIKRLWHQTVILTTGAWR